MTWYVTKIWPPIREPPELQVLHKLPMAEPPMKTEETDMSKQEAAWQAGMTEDEYEAAMAAENLDELRHPELQGPEWNLDRNDSYLPYQQAEREPADKYREREMEAGQ